MLITLHKEIFGFVDFFSTISLLFFLSISLIHLLLLHLRHVGRPWQDFFKVINSLVIIKEINWISNKTDIKNERDEARSQSVLQITWSFMQITESLALITKSLATITLVVAVMAAVLIYDSPPLPFFYLLVCFSLLRFLLWHWCGTGNIMADLAWLLYPKHSWQWFVSDSWYQWWIHTHFGRLCKWTPCVIWPPVQLSLQRSQATFLLISSFFTYLFCQSCWTMFTSAIKFWFLFFNQAILNLWSTKSTSGIFTAILSHS